jgi:acyl-CoA thioesterase-1
VSSSSIENAARVVVLSIAVSKNGVPIGPTVGANAIDGGPAGQVPTSRKDRPSRRSAPASTTSYFLDMATAPARAALRYVALGDSYTIGTSVAPGERWPDQLMASLREATPTLELVANLGVNGYTSADLLRDELPALARLGPEFVSVLIGVNDVVQGVPAATYEEHVAAILDALLEGLPAARILTVATPDYTVTPAGADYGDPDRQHAGIVATNATMERLATRRGIAFVDTFDLSLRATHDRTLVAADGLHPSGPQYALWVDRIRPVVEDLLRR